MLPLISPAHKLMFFASAVLRRFVWAVYSSMKASSLGQFLDLLAVKLCHFMRYLTKQISRYQITFSANWISLAVVVVEVSRPATPVGAPVESKMSVLSGLNGTEKFA
jgi:hypothetical protein